MKLSRISSLLVFVLSITACVTDPEPKEIEADSLPKSPSVYLRTNPLQNQYNDIDLNALSIELNMTNSFDQLGYQEKLFNTCEIKSNRSPRPFCENLYLSQLHFQMMCRDSTGTVEKVTLEPLISDQLRWKSRNIKGSARTNNEGFGRLDFISKQSSHKEALYFSIGNKMARKSFKDYWRLILPKNWCNPF